MAGGIFLRVPSAVSLTMNNIPPAVNGAELRMDAILAELRAIRKRIEEGNPQPEAIEIREPKVQAHPGSYALRKRK